MGVRNCQGGDAFVGRARDVCANSRRAASEIVRMVGKLIGGFLLPLVLELRWFLDDQLSWATRDGPQWAIAHAK
jgi:hypothetical protein